MYHLDWARARAQGSDVKSEETQVISLWHGQDSNPDAPGTQSPADWMPAHKPFGQSRILWSPELKNLLEFKYLSDKSWNLI